jgi:hypothetical protein
VKEVVEEAQVIENMERETGIEPATSSLGKGTSIENKEHRVLVIFVPAIEDNGFSTSALPRSLLVLK